MQITPFRIARLDAFALRIPFHDFVVGPRPSPQGWREFDMVLVRVETDDGVVGWGECFAYSCLRATLAAVQDMAFPLLLGREVTDIGRRHRVVGHCRATGGSSAVRLHRRDPA